MYTKHTGLFEEYFLGDTILEDLMYYHDKQPKIEKLKYINISAKIHFKIP